MKRKLSISALVVNFILALFAGALIFSITGFNPLITAGVLYAASTGAQLAFPAMLRGVAMEGINQEIWTDVLVEQFRETENAQFLNEIPDESRHVVATRGENEIIHLVDVGADPEVIINNITYPIGTATQTDGDIPISLDTYVTVATKVGQEEIQYVAYDKIRLVQKKHAAAVMSVKHNKAVHALAPGAETITTPVLVTTGPDDGTGRKRLILKDLITHMKQYNDQKIPMMGRNLVLSTQHHTDLLIECTEAKKSADHLSFDESGMLATRLYSFKTWVYVDMPHYSLATLTKKSFGASIVAGDVEASVSFYAPDQFRASGLSKNYADEPTTQTHAWLYNVRHNYIVLPRKQRATGAIVSADV
jgi:hypothetical protein